MQEDIKILKELTEEYNSQHYMDMPLINGKQIQALENLLKGYRELEERIIFLTNLSCINDSDENYIPKSKIKEIRDKAEVMDYYVLGDVIDDLNKLLGDEE